MTLLSPWAAVVAAAVAVPALLVLYFLKLRRMTLRIPSTMLWQSSAEDLQANVPFQRLRISLLLLLQLLLLTLLILALARPVLESLGGTTSKVILLVDRSASMSAADMSGPDEPPKTRLDAAKEAARETIRRLGRRSEPAQVMIVAFGASAKVISGFQSSRQALLDAIDTIEPSDEQADLEAALRLAAAFARGESEGEGSAPPEIVLLSDGGVAPGDFALDAGTLRFVGLGPTTPVENVGIATFSARRDYEDPARVLVFARLVNAAPQQTGVTATLRADGEAVEIRSVIIPGADAQGPGAAALSLSIDLPRAAVLSLTCAMPDALSADNAAALVMRAPAAPQVGVVHSGTAPDPFLVGLIEALDPQRLVLLPVPEGEPVTLPWTAGDVDLVIYDRLDGPLPARLPTLTFGGAPSGLVRRPSTRPGAARVLSWQRDHPLLRHVNLDALRFLGTGGLQLPQGWDALAIGPEGAVIAAQPAGETRHAVVAFPLSESNWPVDVSIAVFLQNALEYLVGGASGEGLSFRPGEPIAVRCAPDAQELRITGPVSLGLPIGLGEDATVALPRVGLYGVAGAEPPFDRLALNLASEVESDIRPRDTVVINAQPAVAEGAGDAAPLELWPALAAAALILLVIEWIFYCLRAGGRGIGRPNRP